MTNPRRVDTPLSRTQLLNFLLGYDGNWVRMDTIPTVFPMPNYPNVIIARMKRIGLVERTWITDGENAGKYVRITLAGREALQTGQLMSRQKYTALKMTRTAKEKLIEIAKEAGAKGVGEMLGMIVARKDAFIRWYKFMESEK